MNAALYALVAALSFGAAWGIQGLRWSEHDALARSEADRAISANVDAINQRLISSREETEKYRAQYLEYQSNAKSEIDDLERRITAGPERLYIKAKCPALPATGADASRATTGTAELDATATGYYLALERGLADQYGLLQLCRSELKKRSR